MGCNTIKTDITSSNGTVYHVESDVTIVREVYQNIPSSLKDAKTQSFTHVKGGPVTDKGRDYDSKLDGQSIFDRSKYYYAGPVFYGTAEDGKSTNGITQLKGNTSIQQQTLAQNINGVGGAVGQNGAGGMTSNIVNAISTWPDLTKEVSLREGFYNATNLVDAYLQTNPVTGKNYFGDGLKGPKDRAALINFVTDGYIEDANTKEGLRHQLLVAWHGLQLIQKQEGIKISDETKKRVNYLLQKNEASGGGKEYEEIKKFIVNEKK
jgi:hypothetical protein